MTTYADTTGMLSLVSLNDIEGLNDIVESMLESIHSPEKDGKSEQGLLRICAQQPKTFHQCGNVSEI